MDSVSETILRRTHVPAVVRFRAEGLSTYVIEGMNSGEMAMDPKDLELKPMIRIIKF